MMKPRILQLFAPLVLQALWLQQAFAQVPEAGPSKTWTLGSQLKATLPITYTQGVAFPIKLEFLNKPALPQKLGLSIDYLKQDGSFGGKLEGVPLRLSVADAVTFNESITISKSKPGMSVALLTIFLSPDGSWKNRTMQAVLPLKPSDVADDKFYNKVAEKALASDGTPPDTEPGLEDYEPRTEFFTQRVDKPEARSWKVAPQVLPPLAEIVALPPQERPVYGVYCWVSEYERAHEEIAKMGITSMRLSGPWGKSDEALKLATKHGVEVLFTLQCGKDKSTYGEKGNRAAFESDEAFIQAFKNNVTEFVQRYGPNGTFQKEFGVASPLAVVELWNEPNFFYMIPDGTNRRAAEPLREALYPKVLKAGFEAVKSLEPSLKVAGFAAGGAESADLRFIERIFKANPQISEFYDILTTHPYNKGAPPEAEKIRKWGTYSIANNLAKIRTFSGEASNKPIWYSELGWHFGGKHGGQFSTPKDRLADTLTPDLHAAYVTRMYIWAMRLGVPRVHIMHLHDADAFNGGFLARNLEWRPAAHATKNLTTLLPHPKLTGAVFDGEGSNYAYIFKPDHKKPAENSVIVAWNTLGPASVEIPVRTAKAELFDMVGNQKLVVVQGGKVQVEIGPFPIYIRESH